MIDADGKLIPKKKTLTAAPVPAEPMKSLPPIGKSEAGEARESTPSPQTDSKIDSRGGSQSLSTEPPPRRSTVGKPKSETVPYSEEAEKGVLASMISPYGGLEAIAAVHGAISPYYFHSPIHRKVYQRVIDLWESNRAIDMITFTQALRDAGELETVGGVGFVTELFTFVPDAANVTYYLEIVRDKFLRREMISAGARMARSAYVEDEEVPKLLENVTRGVEDLKRAAGGPNGSTSFSHEDLKAFVAQDDPNVLLGKRWLCRGFTSLLAGPAGAGKSTLEMQMAMYWGCGLKFCGIRPPRPLKSLILQAENDLGDSAEQYQGVLEGIVKSGAVELDQELVSRNVLVTWVVAKSGFLFCGFLDQMIQLHRPDIVWIDPLFAFAGCDLLKPKETTDFIRGGLYPIAVKRNVALIVVHHIGKSYRDNTEKEKWSDLDFQYLGFGTSEIQNAFRAVTILLPSHHEDSESKVYRLVLSKRGNRAGAKDLLGYPTTNLYLEQASDQGIFWEQVAKPERKPPANLKYTSDDILDEMSAVNGMTAEQMQEHMKKNCGMSPRTFYRLWKDLKKEGKIRVDSEWLWVKKSE